jgi:4-hydroxy-tetrahydrodipicolinate synthase
MADVLKADPLRGGFPILATCFDGQGSIDYGSQERLIEFCIEAGTHGLVTLANASEGHLLSEEEKQQLLRAAGQAGLFDLTRG